MNSTFANLRYIHSYPNELEKILRRCSPTTNSENICKFNCINKTECAFQCSIVICYETLYP